MDISKRRFLIGLGGALAFLSVPKLVTATHVTTKIVVPNPYAMRFVTGFQILSFGRTPNASGNLISLTVRGERMLQLPIGRGGWCSWQAALDGQIVIRPTDYLTIDIEGSTENVLHLHLYSLDRYAGVDGFCPCNECWVIEDGEVTPVFLHRTVRAPTLTIPDERREHVADVPGRSRDHHGLRHDVVGGRGAALPGDLDDYSRGIILGSGE